MLTLIRRYRLETEHTLTAGVPERYREPHRHEYTILLTIGGPVDDDGLIVEYDALDKVVLPVLAHARKNLNTLNERCSTREAAAVAANPTVERLVLWLVARLRGVVASTITGVALELQSIRIEEDHDAAVEWSDLRGLLRGAYEAGREAGRQETTR